MSNVGSQVSDFDYDLPEDLIAQEPPAQRGASRMLVVSRQNQSFRDDEFRNFSRFVMPGDCLVLNNTRVFPARLQGHRNAPTGAVIEIFLLRALDETEKTWRALLKPAKRARTGDEILLQNGITVEVLSEGEFGERIIRFSTHDEIAEVLDQIGETPLPPYIRRHSTHKDKERYQTIFAQRRGSAAAPTAGLHFTPETIAACRSAGSNIAYVTLHVGLGTFAPIRVKETAAISLHEEYFEISAAAAEQLQNSRRLVCVGTTSVRTVETAMLRGGFSAMNGETNLFISPGFHFRATGAMLTNFHLPQSSLLMLVCAFAGRDLVLAAYRHAVKERYRFFSYGDCMLIE